MIPFQLANANASVIAVTTTPANVKSLIDAAGSTAHSFPPGLDGLDIVPENGDIRIIYDGNSPTSSKGLLIKSGCTLFLRRENLSLIQLVAVTGSVTCSVQVGKSEEGETTAVSGAGGSGGGSSSTSSSASTGGGNSTYSNVQGDFVATANSATRTITLSAFTSSILSAALTTKSFANCVIKRISTGGAVDTLPLTTISYSAGVLTLTDMTANFNAGDTVVMFVPGPDKSFDTTNNQSQVTQTTKMAGEDLTNDVMKVQPQASYTVPLTASALVKTGAGQLFGWVVNSASAGATLKIWDNTSAATTVLLDTMTYTAAVNQGPTVNMLPAAVKFGTGCYFTISGTASITPIWN